MVLNKKFPRGQKPQISDTTTKKNKNLYSKSDNEPTLFGNKNPNNKRKSNETNKTNLKKKKSKSADNLLKDPKSLDQFKTSKKSAISQPTFKTLAVNEPILGQIFKINQYEAQVLLPNNQKGFVYFDQEFEFNYQNLNAGDFMLCTPKMLDNGVARLTFNPKIINSSIIKSKESIDIGHALSGVIKSKEDSGYEIDLKIDSNKFRAFLPIDEDSGIHQELEIGDLHIFTIKSKRKAALTLSLFSVEPNNLPKSSTSKNLTSGCYLKFNNDDKLQIFTSSSKNDYGKVTGNFNGQNFVIWNFSCFERLGKFDLAENLAKILKFDCYVNLVDKESKNLHLTCVGIEMQKEEIDNEMSDDSKVSNYLQLEKESDNQIGQIQEGRLVKILGEAGKNYLLVKNNEKENIGQVLGEISFIFMKFKFFNLVTLLFCTKNYVNNTFMKPRHNTSLKITKKGRSNSR